MPLSSLQLDSKVLLFGKVTCLDIIVAPSHNFAEGVITFVAPKIFRMITFPDIFFCLFLFSLESNTTFILCALLF